MILGALLDAGLEAGALEHELRKLELPEWRLQTQRVKRGSLAALYADFVVQGLPGEARAYPAIDGLIAASDVCEPARTRARGMFRRLAEVEAAVHGVALEQAHFHELGAVDSVLDIVGAAVAMHLLGIESVRVSPLNVGGGTVSTQHGELPVPAPATLALLEGEGAHVYSTVDDTELLTPTGALILTSFAQSYGPLPAMRVRAHGYGAGRMELPFPNVLRVTLGDPAPADEADRVTVVETDIDDMNPELLAHAGDQLIAAGALDVTTTALGMKKGRTGTRITAIAPPERADAVVEALLRETTTLGVRMHEARRRKLPRREFTVTTEFGRITVKASYLNHRLRDVAPAADDCRQAALRYGQPVRTVYDAARAAGLEEAPTQLEPGSAGGAAE